jgi:hypothetical protein
MLCQFSEATRRSLHHSTDMAANAPAAVIDLTALSDSSTPPRKRSENVARSNAGVRCNPTASRVILSELCNALENVRSSGSFAAITRLHSIRPGLEINGIGPVSTPLQPEIARQIIKQARQAPYGKGEKTVVDTSVRKTWELDASQFSFREAGWKAQISAIVMSAASQLGIDVASTPVRAEIYKMLLYEEGAMFKAHTE